MESEVERWLLHSNYKVELRPRIKVDLVANLRKFPGLRINQTTMTENSRPCKILCLEGCLPASYQNALFNIPIICLIPPRYLFSTPLIFVKNPPNTIIQESVHLEKDGLVKHPSLLHWDHYKSSLGNVLEELSLSFSQYFPIASVTGPQVVHNPQVMLEEKKSFRPDISNPVHSVYFRIAQRENTLQTSIDSLSSLITGNALEDPVSMILQLKQMHHDKFILSRKKEKCVLILSKIS